jgi:hypothetical protein
MNHALRAAVRDLATLKPHLRAVVRLKPKGQNVVTLTPDERDPVSLMCFLLAYAAKVRWLINDSPVAVRTMYTAVLAEAVHFWSSDTVCDLLTETELVHVVTAFREGALPSAVAGGETFRMAYFETDSARTVENQVPQPSLAINLAWHLAPLLQEVRTRIRPEDRVWTQQALQIWAVVSDEPSADLTTAESLAHLWTMATGAVSFAWSRR